MELPKTKAVKEELLAKMVREFLTDFPDRLMTAGEGQ